MDTTTEPDSTTTTPGAMRRKHLEREARRIRAELEEHRPHGPEWLKDVQASQRRAEVLGEQLKAVELQLDRLHEEEVDTARKAAGAPGTLAERLDALERQTRSDHEVLRNVATIAKSAFQDVDRINKHVLPPESMVELILDAVKKLVDARLAKMKSEVGGLVWLGPFENGKSYSPGQCVRHSGDAWVCTVETGTAPSADNAMWSLVVRGAR